MSDVAALRRGPWEGGQKEVVAVSPLPLVADHLGPARVLSVTPDEVRVDISGAEVSAVMALAFPYRPAIGDLLLVIGKGNEHYVIGVIQGAGHSTFTFPGNVEIRADRGELSLSAEKGVKVSSSEIALEATTVRVTAGALVQKLTSAYQRVRELLSVHAGEQEVVVDGSALTRAKSATVLTEENMTINGKQIHLG